MGEGAGLQGAVELIIIQGKLSPKTIHRESFMIYKRESFMIYKRESFMIYKLRFAGYIFLFLAAFLAVFIFSNWRTTIFWFVIFIMIYIFCNVLAEFIEQSENIELLKSKKVSWYNYDDPNYCTREDVAVVYCAKLIEHYEASQRLNRSFYYIVQLSTIIFSGITPVLIVIGTNTDLPHIAAVKPWADWLSIILPALAAILASISTSVPLQKDWINSKITKENLEAELQAFKLGTTDLYRVYDDDGTSSDEKIRKQKVLDTFIDRVNKIHLQEVTQWAQLQLQKDKESQEQVPGTRTPLKIISDKKELNYGETAHIRVEPKQSVNWSVNHHLGSFNRTKGVATVYTAPTEEEAKDDEGNPIAEVIIIAKSVDATNLSSSLLIAIRRDPY